ncbi:MAG: serpin family protein [Bacteroidia bacterium]
MNKCSIYVFLSLLSILGVSCTEKAPLVEDGTLIGSGIHSDFDTDLFRSVIGNEPQDKNVVISPISVSSVLRMILAGAEGNSANEIVQAYGDSLFANELLADAKNFNNWLATRSRSPIIELSNAMFYDIDAKKKEK